MRIVINKSWGRAELSPAAYSDLGWEPHSFTDSLDDRTNADLIDLIDLRGSEYVSGKYANLHIVEIADNVYFQIHEYDGMESVIWSESPIHWA